MTAIPETTNDTNMHFGQHASTFSVLKRHAVTSLLLFSLLLSSVCAAATPNFQDDVLPIFKQHCLGCHNADQQKAGLNLSSFAALESGSSGGAVVSAGLPDTSPLMMAIRHAEGYAPMPPNKPKIPAAKIEIIGSWIASGLIAAKGSKSQLRDMDVALGIGNSTRPKTPAVPINLPDVPLAKTNRANPIVAAAASPWADVYAFNGNEQVVLYGKRQPSVLDADFSPVAFDDLVSRHTFDRPIEGHTLTEGMLGKAIRITQGDFIDEQVPPDVLSKRPEFTFAAWLKPDSDMKQPTVYGRESMYIMLERTKNGWRVRTAHRAANNAVVYLGRMGEFLEGGWQHIAVTSDGTEWAFFNNGNEVVRQKVPEDKTGLLERLEPFYIGGDGKNKDRRYRGGMDDLRFYNRALSPDEIAQLIRNAVPSFAHIGTLPFSEGDIRDLNFSRSGELLIAAGGLGADSGGAAVYDVASGQQKAKLGNELDTVLSADISSDHQYVAFGTPSRLVKLFSTKSGEMLHRIEKHTNWVTVVRFSPDGKLLATADRNGGIHVWETESGGIVYTLDQHKVMVTALAWRGDGKILASAAEDGKFVLWDMKDGWATRTITAHAEKSENRYTRRTGILSIAFGPEGHLLTTGRDRSIKLWNTDGTRVAEANYLDAIPLKAIFAADGKSALIGDFQGKVTAWSLPGLTKVQTLNTE